MHIIEEIYLHTVSTLKEISKPEGSNESKKKTNSAHIKAFFIID